MSRFSWSNEMVEYLLKNYEKYTYKELAKKFSKKFNIDITHNAIRKAYERYKYPMKEISKKENGPKILIFDIETAPMEAYIWSLFPERVGLNMVKQDWTVLSFAAKWVGDNKVIYEDVSGQRDVRNDKKVLKKIWKLLDEADIVVGQNSNQFDIKKLNARFILNGMQPPSSYKRLDTKVLAKRHFSFTSNRLAYMTDKLCTDNKKSEHNEFPGFSMWEECLKGNKKAFKAMKEYNILDVTSLEELFKKFLPWENAALYDLYYTDDTIRCTCGSTDFKKNGFYRTNACKYQKYRCKKCGAEYRDTQNLEDKNRRKRRPTKR